MSGASRSFPQSAQSGSVIVSQTEPEDRPVGSLWAEIDDADPPNLIALHVAVA